MFWSFSLFLFFLMVDPILVGCLRFIYKSFFISWTIAWNFNHFHGFDWKQIIMYGVRLPWAVTLCHHTHTHNTFIWYISSFSFSCKKMSFSFMYPLHKFIIVTRIPSKCSHILIHAILFLSLFYFNLFIYCWQQRMSSKYPKKKSCK